MIESPSTFSLDIFDSPVKDHLYFIVKSLGHDPHELLPVIEVAIKRAKELIRKPEESIFYPQIIMYKIIEEALRYILGVLSQSEKFASAYKRIRSYSSIFLVGAGLSFESNMPLSDTLEDLLKFCGVENYDELRKNKKKCLKFKQEFKKICNKKSVGTSHKLIAHNFPKYILEIICLNWDNLIERAAKELGKVINKINEDVAVTGERYLWKFHGDVDNIKKDNVKGKGGWVFPDEEGYVFNNFSKYVEEKGLLNSIFTFVIVGYSEKERNIYKKIIETFEKKPKRPTFRVGLDLKRLHDKNYIVGPADFVLKNILPLQL
jgi:hypothetical protein